MLNNTIYAQGAGIVLMLLCLFLFYQLIKRKQKLDDKNIEAMKFYLDNQFICRKLTENLLVTDTNIFCAKLLDEIKEYYNLQDIIVVDSIDTVIDEYRITALRSAVINFLKENEYRIIHTRIDHRLSKLNAFLLKNNYVLYISKLSEIRESDGFVICIESSPSLLSRHEIDTLNNCINLLKTRLFY